MLTKEQLVHLVERLLGGQGSVEQLEEWLRIVENNVPDPNVSDLIYLPSKNGLGPEPTATQIVERALSYTPIQL